MRGGLRWLAVGGLLLIGGAMAFVRRTQTKVAGPTRATTFSITAGVDAGQDPDRRVPDRVIERVEQPGHASSGVSVPRDASPSASAEKLEQAENLPKSNSNEIRRLLQLALDIDPRNVRALKDLGDLSLEQEAYDEAIALAARCLDEVPGDRECTDLRNMAKGRSGRLDALEMERAYETSPNDFGRVQGLTQVRIKQGRLDDARRLIEKMSAINPLSALIPTMEGDIAKASGDQATAQDKYQAACSQGQEYACKMAWQLRSRDQ